jgi:undecaprenyl-diphosphatase
VTLRGTWLTAGVLGGALIVLTALVALQWGPLITADNAAAVAADTALAAHAAQVIVVKLVTNAGSPLSIDLLSAAVAICLLIRRRVRAALYIVAVRGLELGMETLLKVVVDRPRPSVPTALATAQGMSFPSGHTAGTAALCVSLLLLAQPLLAAHGGAPAVAAAGVAAVAAIVAVAVSRVLLGVHYPSDVLGGALLGTLCAVVLGPFVSRRRVGD